MKACAGSITSTTSIPRSLSPAVCVTDFVMFSPCRNIFYIIRRTCVYRPRIYSQTNFFVLLAWLPGVQKVGTAGNGQTTFSWTKWDWYEKIIGYMMKMYCLTMTTWTFGSLTSDTLSDEYQILCILNWKWCPFCHGFNNRTYTLCWTNKHSETVVSDKKILDPCRSPPSLWSYPAHWHPCKTTGPQYQLQHRCPRSWCRPWACPSSPPKTQPSIFGRMTSSVAQGQVNPFPPRLTV